MVKRLARERRHHRLELRDLRKLRVRLSEARHFVVTADSRPTAARDDAGPARAATSTVITLYVADYASWRAEAKRALECGVDPGDILWVDALAEQQTLPMATATRSEGESGDRSDGATLRASRRAAQRSASVRRHCDAGVLPSRPDRWVLLYRLLWRMRTRVSRSTSPRTTTCTRSSRWRRRCGATSTRCGRSCASRESEDDRANATSPGIGPTI